MNTNFLHNIMNWAMALIAAFSVPEVVGLLPPDVAVKLVGALAVVKSMINVFRDGVAGLVKNQPPVQ